MQQSIQSIPCIHIRLDLSVALVCASASTAVAEQKLEASNAAQPIHGVFF
jgi:hypothetical protein